MLDVNEYGVVALNERALMAIEGGDGGACKQVAYAIGYALGWVAHEVVDGITSSGDFMVSYESAQM